MCSFSSSIGAFSESFFGNSSKSFIINSFWKSIGNPLGISIRNFFKNSIGNSPMKYTSEITAGIPSVPELQWPYLQDFFFYKYFRRFSRIVPIILLEITSWVLRELFVQEYYQKILQKFLMKSLVTSLEGSSRRCFGMDPAVSLGIPPVVSLGFHTQK